MKKSLIRTGKIFAVAFALVLTGASVYGQGVPALFGNSRPNNTKRDADIPTHITAQTMDIDMGRNMVTFIGNVFVDDQDMSIRCNKMIIYLEDKSDSKKTDKDGNAKSGEPQTVKESDSKGGGKRPVRFECYNDVVVTGKAKGSDQKEQKATAGKAVYDLVKDEIELSDKPVLLNGKDRITGSKIKIIVNENRMLVFQAGAEAYMDGLEDRK